MKILQLIHATQLRGAEIFACQLAEHLRSLNNEVIVVALYNHKSQMPTSLPVHHLNCVNGLDPSAMFRLHSIIKKNNIDIVQTNAGDTLKFAAISKMLFRWQAKLIVRNATTMGDLIRNKLHRFSYNILLKTVAKIISVSSHEAEDIKKLFPRCANKTFMIPIGIDRASQHDNVRGRNKNVLLHVGAFNREKNHAGLIRIFRKVLSQKPNTVLWLVGEGPLRKNIETMVKRYDIEDNVEFLGKRNDVYDLMRQATLFVLPSHTEGLPGVILESMHSELPIIANNVGGIREAIKNNETGWLIEKDQEDVFAKKIIEVLDAPTSVTDIVTKAHALVTNEFDNKNISHKFLSIYKETVM